MQRIFRLSESIFAQAKRNLNSFPLFLSFFSSGLFDGLNMHMFINEK